MSYRAVALAFCFMSGCLLNAQVPAADETKTCGNNAAFLRWRDEDAAYLLTEQERAHLNGLHSVSACESFIEKFWRDRDPDRSTVQNEYKIEHYRRIAYANERFSQKVPGWKTDRGRIYITYGAPDEIDSYPSGISSARPKEEGGGVTATYPLERWKYNTLPSIGENILIEFVDRSGSGEYRMVATVDIRRPE